MCRKKWAQEDRSLEDPKDEYPEIVKLDYTQNVNRV